MNIQIENIMAKNFKEIIFNETYESFKDFYSNNNEIIYQGIIELFQEFINNKLTQEG